MTKVSNASTMQEYGAVLPQWLGMAGLVFCAIFWAATRDINGLLVSAFIGLIGLGQGAEAVVAIKRMPTAGPPAPPPGQPVGDEGA